MCSLYKYSDDFRSSSSMCSLYKYSDDFRSSSSMCSLYKYSDDFALADFSNSDSHFEQQVTELTRWCKENYLDQGDGIRI